MWGHSERGMQFGMEAYVSGDELSMGVDFHGGDVMMLEERKMVLLMVRRGEDVICTAS